MVTETLSKEQAAAIAYFEQKLSFEIGPVELKMGIERGEKYQIIDLRTPELFGKAHIPGAENVLFESLESHLPKLKKEITSVVYCYNHLCHLSARAALTLAKNGYKVRELAGGFDGWAEREFQVEAQKQKSSCSSSCG